MKYLRKYIRALLLESPELQDAFSEFRWNRQEGEMTTVPEDPDPDSGDNMSVGTWHHDELTKKLGKKKATEYINLKREMKGFWNKHADHDYWKTVKCVHSLNYYNLMGGDVSRGEIDLSVSAFIEKYKPNKVHKDEMSCYGILESSYNIKGKGIILSGRITWAGLTDAFSESRGSASAKDLQRHQGSGLPKRPGLSNTSGEGVLFDQQDVLSVLGKYNQFYIEEVIVDNWRWNTLIWPYNPFEDIHQEVLALNAKGIKVVDEDFEEYTYTDKDIKKFKRKFQKL